jgi:hypothetical protein
MIFYNNLCNCLNFQNKKKNLIDFFLLVEIRAQNNNEYLSEMKTKRVNIDKNK